MHFSILFTSSFYFKFSNAEDPSTFIYIVCRLLLYYADAFWIKFPAPECTSVQWPAGGVVHIYSITLFVWRWVCYMNEWTNEQAVCLGPWGKGVCERPPQQPCPAYSFSWRPSLMPVSHAAGDEHFTATVQFLCLGTLTFPASSKRILFSGLCWDGSVLEIRLIDCISHCRLSAFVCLFINILFSWKCTQMTLWRGRCVRGSGLFSLDKPDSLKKMRMFFPVWCCGS